MSEAPPADGQSAGAILRAAREAAGLHVATLAANLKVPVRKLEALEEDRYDLLGDAVFVRALASSVCRTLKLDPQLVLARLPQTAQPRLVPDTEGINAPFRSSSDGPTPGWLDQVSRPVVLSVVALLLAAVVLIFLPSLQRGYETVSQAVQQPLHPEPVLPPGTTPPPAPAEPQGTELVAAAPGPSASEAVPPMAAAAPAAVPTAATTAPAASAAVGAEAPAASEPAPATTGPIPARGVVLFRTRGPSWVQVTDATGNTVLRRLMGPGESAGASGALPLSVTVGDAGVTEVQVRGRPYDLAPVARDNVARFEVK